MGDQDTTQNKPETELEIVPFNTFGSNIMADKSKCKGIQWYCRPHDLNHLYDPESKSLYTVPTSSLEAMRNPQEAAKNFDETQPVEWYCAQHDIVHVMVPSDEK